MDPADHPARPPAASTHPPEPPDDPTLERLRRGDPAVFQTLVRPLLPSLLALARRLTRDPHWAEDLTQETLVRACRGIRGFRGDASLRTWLFRILVRLASQPGRWRGQAPTPSPALAKIPDSLAAPPDLHWRERELAERLDEAMERLTTRQRSALHLRAVEGLDYRAIARVLGGSSAAARMLVLAARRRILARMGRHLSP